MHDGVNAADRFAIDPVDHFIGASTLRAAEYRRVMRGKAEPLEPLGPERFVRDFVAGLFDVRGAVLERQGLLVARALDALPRLNGLSLVAGAFLAHRAGEAGLAIRLAGRAYAQDQHETFAQRLLLAAREGSASLRLEVDDWLQDRFCPNPFTDAEIIGSREAYSCCAAWLPAPLGSAVEGSDWWTSDRATEIRRSILDGDFSYCSRLSCPRIAARDLPRRSAVSAPDLARAIATDGRDVPDRPARLLLSYDTSCNLSCPSCRAERLTLPAAESAALDVWYDARLAPLVATADRVKVTGSGDPFGSRHFRHVVAGMTPRPERPALQLQTNGVLLDARAWEELGLEGKVRSIWISVDAAEPATYARLRRGGDFDRLLHNLRFLGEKRRSGAFGELRLDFVVQADNYRQMPDFVRLAREIGADGVHFLALRNWGTFAPAEYASLAVTLPEHPEHADLLEVLAEPILGAPDVDLGNLAPLRPAVPAIGAVPVILVLGTARTGSNYLFQALRSFPEVMALSEVFNPSGAFGIEHYRSALLPALADRDGIAYEGEKDSRLIARLRADPESALADLQILARKAGRKALAIKVFADHLPRRTIRALLALPGVHPVVIRRDLVSAHVSLLKARERGTWRLEDTTGLKVAVDPAAAVRWIGYTAAWYRSIGAAIDAAGRPRVTLDYNRITTETPEALMARLAAILGDLGVTVAADTPPKMTLSRQDRTEDVFDRCANGEALRAALRQAGLLEAALQPPALGWDDP